MANETTALRGNNDDNGCPKGVGALLGGVAGAAFISLPFVLDFHGNSAVGIAALVGLLVGAARGGGDEYLVRTERCGARIFERCTGRQSITYNASVERIHTV